MRMSINYGVNKVRFITQVPVGSRSARFTPSAVKDTGDSGRAGDLERDDRARGRRKKPCAVVEWITRYYPNLSEHLKLRIRFENLRIWRDLRIWRLKIMQILES